MQAVTFRHRVIALVEEGYGKIQVKGSVRPKDSGNKAMEDRKAKEEMDRKEEPRV